MAAIARTGMWQTRQRDHLYVGLDYETLCVPGVPVAAADGGGAPHVSCEVRNDRPRHPQMMRAFVESHWSDVNLGSSPFHHLLEGHVGCAKILACSIASL